MGDRRVSNMFNSGMKNCPRCQSQNHINADYCPRCNHQFSTIFMQQTGPGQYAPHPAHGFGKKQQKWMWWTLGGLGVAALSCILFAVMVPSFFEDPRLSGTWDCVGITGSSEPTTIVLYPNLRYEMVTNGYQYSGEWGVINDLIYFQDDDGWTGDQQYRFQGATLITSEWECSKATRN